MLHSTHRVNMKNQIHEAEKIDDLTWRDLLATAKQSMAYCRETAGPSFNILIAASALSSLQPAALAALMGLIVNVVQNMLEAGEPDLLLLLPWLAGFAAILLGNGILQAIQSYRESVLSAEMDMVLAKRVMEHRMVLDMSFLEQPENNDLLSRGVHFAGREFLRFIMQIVKMGSLAIQFVTLLGVMMWILPLATPLLAMLTAPMIIFRWRISKMRYKLSYSMTSRTRLRAYYAGELASNRSLSTVKIFGLKSILAERYEALSLELIDLDRKLHRRSAFGQAAGALAFALLFMLAAGWAAYEALAGTLAIGSLVTYLASANRFRSSINSITTTVSTVFINLLFVRNLYTFFEVQPTIQVGSGIEPDEVKGKIELRDVSFTYPGAAAETLHKINLVIEPGETIALVGGNGAGKTTLANLIIRLYDVTEGAVLMDDIDVRKLSADWLYKQIAYVGQAVVMLEMTAADNIAFGDLERLDGNRELISQIVSRTGIQTIVDKMPDGLDTVLGRRFGNYSLSGGEWQRMSVARALAKDAPILVFDEPMANMDARAEFELFTALRKVTVEKTSIIISHRFATVRSADRIVVLDEGQIAEVGSHDELIKLGKIYAGLYTIQQAALNG